MFDDFVIVATALKLTFALVAIYAAVRVSSWLDDRADNPFSDTIKIILRNDLGTGLYYGLRFLAICLLLGMVIGCTPAAAGTAFPSKYDSDFRRAVDTYWPDYPRWQSWKAQGYAESRLDPRAVSLVGARGLVQMMPATWAEVTRELRLGEVSPHADVAIQAGAYYMAKLRKGWLSERPAHDRQQLAQASYNAGPGSLIKAQRLCDGGALYAQIIRCLPAVTGNHSRETITYVDRIDRYTAAMEAGL